MKPETATEFISLMRERLKEIDEEEKISGDNRATVTLDQQAVGRLSRMDALQQQAMAQATQQRRLAERQQLKQALARITDGSFGYCEDCGEEIALPRLRLNPALRRCMGCISG